MTYPNLQQGATGPYVKALQSGLNTYFKANLLVVDGVFGPATESVLKQFQTKQWVDGVVDNTDWQALGFPPVPSPPPPPPPPPPTTPVPAGVPGTWKLVFQDEFNGTSLDTSRWKALEGYHTNNVTTHASNVSVSGGNLVLTLASSSSGAEVDSNPAEGAGSNGYKFAIGHVVEARIMFPGSGTSIDNWPAFWVSGPNWPSSGEIDIAEGLGSLTVNYHSPSGAHNLGTVSGTWAGGFHTYACHRMATSFDVYWDGKLVKSHSTDDNGNPHSVLINVGNGAGPPVYGTGSNVLVDYVRAWTPG